MWLSDAGEIIRNFHMWFKYGLKAQKLLEAVRPEPTVTGRRER